jgi:hypothetical protein
MNFGFYMVIESRVKFEIRRVGHMELEALEVPNPATNTITPSPKMNTDRVTDKGYEETDCKDTRDITNIRNTDIANDTIGTTIDKPSESDRSFFRIVGTCSYREFVFLWRF